MKIVIAGAGSVGIHLANMLSKQEHDITLIDNDEERLQLIDGQMDILTVVGSCTSVGALRDAAVGKCDLYIAVNHNEDQNINSAILAKKLGAKKTIVRVNNSEYLEKDNTTYLESIGIDSLIYPERLAAEEIVNVLKESGARQVHDFSNKKLNLISIKLWENALVLDQTLMDIGRSYGTDNFRVVAIKRNNKTIIPRGTDLLKYADMIYVVTKPEYIPEIFNLCGKQQVEIKNVLIVGASKIGVKTASLLEKLHYNVKLLEIDREKCLEIADKLESTLVINGDGRDLMTLKEEGLSNTDAFISVTHSSETNILTCLLAKKNGVKKSVAEVENMSYIDLAENIGIGSIVNTKLTTAAHIFSHTTNVRMKCMRFLTVSEAEVFEIKAEENSKITRKMLKDIKFPENATVGGIIRGEERIIAKGDTRIQAGDQVVIFALQEVVKKVISLFQK